LRNLGQNQVIVVSPPLNPERQAKLREMQQNEKLNKIFALSAEKQKRKQHEDTHQPVSPQTSREFFCHQNLSEIWFNNPGTPLNSFLISTPVITLSTTSGSQTTDDYV
jgi:hypothetical protein